MKHLLFICAASTVFVLPACKKDNQAAFVQNTQKNTDKELIWSQVNQLAKIFDATLDSNAARRNIADGKLSIADLKTAEQQFSSTDPISEYTEELPGVLPLQDNISLTSRFVYLHNNIFYGLQSRGYPSIYAVGFEYELTTGNGQIYGADFTYDGVDPYSIFSFTDLGGPVINKSAYNRGNLAEAYMNIYYRNYEVYCDALYVNPTTYSLKIRLRRVR